jgi:hypothetical protein
MLSIQKSPTDKTGLWYPAPPSDTPFTSETAFVQPAVPEPPPIVEDKGNDEINDDVPGTQKPHSSRRSPICHHCSLSRHVQPLCFLLKAQKAKAKKEVPRQTHQDTRPLAQYQSPWYQASCHQAPRYQALWSHTPRYQASQHQRPQQRFVPANHSGKSKIKSKHLKRSQKVEKMINTIESHLFGCRA